MAKTVTVYFATNRMPFELRANQKPFFGSRIGFGPDPGPFDGKALRFGRAEVVLEPGGEGTLKKVAVADEKLLPTGKDGKIIVGSAQIFEELRRATMEGDGDVLVVLHGYANTFEGGIVGAAEVAERVGRTNVFAFCWPSGEIAAGLNYPEARERARLSGEAIGRAFGALLRYLDALAKKDKACGRHVDVVAHSMGNYALRNTVQAMRSHLAGPDAIRIVDDLVLVAADDDNDTLERDDGIAPVVPFARRVTVYHSRKDFVLQFADRVKFRPDRLGQTGPKNIGLTADNVVAIDVTDVIGDPVDGFLDHWYHRRTPQVIADIRATLEDKGPNPGAILNRIALPTAFRRYRLAPA
ncbi:MAG: alpha/beta hydrolase [Alphaproteobacteria bacterium]|nr:alpha/beta hydrolase [Alphaproteobacteria bacterium]